MVPKRLLFAPSALNIRIKQIEYSGGRSGALWDVSGRGLNAGTRYRRELAE